METNARFLALIEQSIRENWEKPALSDYSVQTYLYKDFAKKIKELHLLFDVLGVQKGDKIALCGRNSSNWVISFFAAISYGAVVTTILHDFNSEYICNIINHSEAKILFSDEYVWDKLDPINIPQVKTIFLIDDFSIVKSFSKELIEARTIWEMAFKEKYPTGLKANELDFHLENPEDLAVLNYTSGTTSNPKGVMIPYRSLWSNTRFAMDNIGFVKDGGGIVCMLPMAHMYGLAFEVLLSVANGSQIFFLTRVPSPKIITDAFAHVQPSLVMMVPLIMEKIVQNRIFVEINKQPTKTLLKLPIIKEIIYKKINTKLVAVFGGRLKEVAIGGAALNKEVENLLKRIKFPYTVGYGMTECGPLIAYEYWEDFAANSCGKVIDRMQVKIDSEDAENVAGEILVKGTNVMLGYFKNPEATASVIDKEGWLHTGDLGVIDNLGNLFIKGRSKTMILGSSGQNIYPEEIESLLNNMPYFAETLVIENKGKLVALVYLDADALARKNSFSDSEIQAMLDSELKVINNRLPSFSQITEFRVQKTAFEKTPKQSIRRFLYQI